ncbi:nitroreductase family deazaflavin-dependent oxidoreductase [Nonomuraea sp. NPDC046570]|uniref:nitroreductase family deazaflavin-dependent oxidoreductase n=1 Tax=Nonomuraea sp. NPDC046570 TaxID=3155255 RepID=UPI0033D80FC7
MLYGKEHVRRYQETDGAEGHDWNNTTVLLLTTKGRTSGRPYTTPLIYQRDGENHVVVASKGGAPADPDWYLNLRTYPDVEVQVKGDRFRARARTATDEERSRLWELMNRTWPDYDQYQQKTDREIPVVVLERAA